MRAALFLLLAAVPALAQQHIAPTEAKTPADELKSFKLPPGFAVQLVAAEPDIGKPMQIAWDARGRLWVTTSHAYPFPSADAKDRLFVLSDFAADGKARKVEVFAADLNIPIGVLPLPDCKSVIVSEVGRILKLTDTDGDGKADKKVVLFSGFGTKDTHGMTNSFTLMPDGWVYACHGFSNESKVKGTDGHEVVMHSGHTFRFRPDGSRIEVYTRGQVNPFGMTADPWFNLYTADCHSKPITQLIPGAYYDSFGKPHDGLGYAPHVTNHDHGSTALCGLAWYDANHFPAEYCGNMFLGNVVTNRVNRDKIEWKGSTPVAVEQPDFLTSSDPWFRPTDIKLGPDGALYVADFYNRIIGHYEVDLKHPQRDKDRGRVWRIVHTGEPGASATGGVVGAAASGSTAPVIPFNDLTTASTEAVIELAGNNVITTRQLATEELIRRGEDAIAYVKEAFGGPFLMKRGYLSEHLCWVISRRAEFNNSINNTMSLPYSVAGLRAAELWPSSVRKSIVRTHGLGFEKATVGAFKTDPATSLAKIPHQSMAFIGHTLNATPHSTAWISALSASIRNIDKDDTHLRHAAKITLRNVLADPELQDQLVWALKPIVADSGAAAKVLDEVFLGVPTAYAGWWFSERYASNSIDYSQREKAAEHVGRYGCDYHRVLVYNASSQSDDVARGRWFDSLSRGSAVASAAYPPNAVTAPANTVNGREVADALNALASEKAREEAYQTIRGKALGNLKSTMDASVRDAFSIAKSAGINIGLEAFDVLKDAKRTPGVRAAALDYITGIGGSESVLPTCGDLIAAPGTPAELRLKALAVFARSRRPVDWPVQSELLKTAPYRDAVIVAAGVAGRDPETLFTAVETGKASARLLQEKSVLDALKAKAPQTYQRRVGVLTAGLPSAEAKLTAAIAARVKDYPKAAPNVEAGKKLFTTHCAACHQIGGVGGKVGPNLDGIGARGPDRLHEDVLDPNRNVDAAFRATTLAMADGRVLTGLLLREEGAVLVLADAEGKEQRLPKADVEKQTQSNQSPMPANWVEKLKAEETRDLIGYLASLKVK